MPKILKRVRADNSGATAIEYGLVAAFVALAVVAGLSAIKGSLADVFREVDAGLTATSAAAAAAAAGARVLPARRVRAVRALATSRAMAMVWVMAGQREPRVRGRWN
jgi:pilus assembly protein Flp/PilA